MNVAHIKLKNSGKHISMFSENDFVVQEHTNGWERRTLKQWEKDVASLNDGDTVLDIGAYTGIYSLIAAAINRTLDIKAFEPHPTVNERLRQNIELNRFNIETFNVALSESPSNVYLNVTGSSTLPSGSSLIDIGKEILHKVEVLSVKFDSTIGGNVKLLKMDIEGNELAALMGMQQTLIACHPICFVEILTDEMHCKLCRLFTHLGYTTVTHFDDSRNSSTITDIVESSPPTPGRTNYRFSKISN